MLGASAVQVSIVSYPNVSLILNYRVHLTLMQILIAAGTVLNFLNHAGICLECVLLYTPTISSLVADIAGMPAVWMSRSRGGTSSSHQLARKNYRLQPCTYLQLKLPQNLKPQLRSKPEAATCSRDAGEDTSFADYLLSTLGTGAAGLGVGEIKV